MIDYMNVNSISELTREEFLEFVKFLGHTPAKTEAEDDLWIDKFCDLAQHRKGSDVLFYPEPGKDSPEAMVEEVERYRRENGLPGFKDSDF